MSESNGITKQDLVDLAAGIRSDFRTEMQEMETRFRLHVSEEFERVETKFLAEFWKWGRSADQKIRRVEYSDATTVERLANLEERVFTLERKASGSKE